MPSLKKYEEEGANLGGKVPLDLKNKWIAQAKERGQVSKKNLAAAVKLWLELPEDIQARLLNQSLDTSAFEAMVEQVIDRKLEAFYSDLSPDQLKTLKADAEKTRKKLKK